MPIENRTYRCQYCNASLRTYDMCKTHEEWCKGYQEERKVYQSRLQKIFDNQYMFYAQSPEDIGKCVDHNGNWIETSDYEDFKYPCLVMMFVHEEYIPDEGGKWQHAEVVEYLKYLRKLESMKGECK